MYEYIYIFFYEPSGKYAISKKEKEMVNFRYERKQTHTANGNRFVLVVATM